MIKVYFTASTSANGQADRFYRKIINQLKKCGAEILSGEQIVDPKLLVKDAGIEKKQIFEREKRLIDSADLIVAEVTKPSLGVGGEVVYALIHRKPVLALLAADYEDKISPMLAGNPSDNLFLEIYTESSLPYIVKDFINHAITLSQRRGKLIVIDGGDGSGKTTQAEMLVKYLKNKNIPVKYMDFPQYYHSFHGKTVAKFLRGEFGKIDEVSPYLASLAYALDRASVKREMEDFLRIGGYIIANRYATSNMAHQSAKFKNNNEKKEFLKWVYDLEYKIHKIPKEDLVIFLYVPWHVGLALTQNKPIRSYLQGAVADIHEKDLNYRQTVEKTYLELSEKYKHWRQIDCVADNKIQSKEEIHKKIITLLKQKSYI